MTYIPRKAQNLIACVVLCGALVTASFSFAIVTAFAQGTQTQTLSTQLPPENVNDSAFRLTVCDGPPLPSSVPTPTNLGHTYVPCDFNAVILQVQHLINIAIVLGVLVAIIGFCYMGYLFITGTEGNIKKAKEIFPKLFWGFIIMLTAWFIVYQILSWLTGNSGFAALLGK